MSNPDKDFEKQPLVGVAVDPGLRSSGVVRFEYHHGRSEWPRGVEPIDSGELENSRLRARLYDKPVDVLVIEVLPGVYGTTGADQIATDRQAGRFIEAYEKSAEMRGDRSTTIEIHRSTAKTAVTGKTKGIGDSQVRQGVIDLYGGKSRAFGVKCEDCKGKGWRGKGRPKCESCAGCGWSIPEGPLPGFNGSHVFAALACALAAFAPDGPYYEAEK